MIQGTRCGLGQIPIPCRCSSAGSPALCKIFCPSYSWKWFQAITWNLCYDNLAPRWQRLPGGLKKICCFGGSWETAAPADCTELSQASGQGASGLNASSLARKGTAWAALQMQSPKGMPTSHCGLCWPQELPGLKCLPERRASFREKQVL